MTDSFGRPVPNDQNSLTVGRGGSVLLTDIHLVDKIAHFDRERIPERVVHAKGTGAMGHFAAYKSMAEYTSADFLQAAGRKTPVLVRFSTVIGGSGSADTVRDPRGFATKFYTRQGIYDIVGNDLPVFFIRDAIKFPDVIHSLKPSPDSNLKIPERFWDFYSLTPEATHMITWLYSDRGTIKDYRKIDGFGVNTYIWVNNKSQRHLVKFHWKTMQGLETIDRFEAESLAGSDP
ncbi:MAG: catalase, partial [Clostridiales bacterium]|nr:catalase [Clostridiales bacterium]